MGRRWSKKKKKGQENKKKSEGQKNESRKEYVPIFQGNARMEAYYALQGLHDDYLDEETQTFQKCNTDEEREAERSKWMESLRSILPASFRIGTDVDVVLRERLEKELEEFMGTELEIQVEKDEGKRGYLNPDEEKGEVESPNGDCIIKKIPPTRSIPFVPHGYQLSVDRRTIRRNPALNKFHEWLKIQTLAGFVTRQETVSMIPPVVLDPEPSNSVLDMCAAPGSKTSQLLEIVSSATDPTDKEPRGCVVANDSDPKRAYMLVHQLKRLQSPAVFISSCDAQFFPLLRNKADKTEEEGLFDRVLADVPCSGDGTMRKNPGIWKHWNQLGALALHSLQLSIALKGAHLTKVGGYLCYSTCSLNPIENESVVAEIVRLSEGSLELVDKRPDMPGLVARPGWTTWKVLQEEVSKNEVKRKRKKNNVKMMQKRKAWKEKEEKEAAAANNGEEKDETIDQQEGNTEAKDNDEDEKEEEGEEPQKVDLRKDYGPPPSWDEETLTIRMKSLGFVEYKSYDDVPEEWRKRVRPSCFPPTKEEAAKMGLEKCMRVLSHDMNTGGFFVALFRKVAPLSAKAREQATKLAEDSRRDKRAPPAKRARIEGQQLSKTTTLNEEDAAMEDVLDDSESNVVPSDVVLDEITSNKLDDLQEENNTPEEPTKYPRKRVTRDDKDSFVVIGADIFDPLIDFYGLSPSFPREQFMVRAGGEAKVLYFMNTAVTKLIDRGLQERVTVINSGLKGFQRSKQAGCEVRYRVTQEAIQFICQYMTKRKLVAKLDDFEKCIAPGGIKFETFSDEFATSMKELSVGSFVVICEGFENDIFKKMCMVMWRCRGEAINCLVAQVEMDGMRSKIRSVREEQQKMGN